MPDFKDLLWFVMRNRSNKTFVGMSYLQVATLLKVGLDDNTLWFKEDGNGKILGMVLGEIDTAKKQIFIKENLAMSKANLIEFSRKARQEFPDYVFHWFKHGKHKTWPTDKFFRKLIGV